MRQDLVRGSSSSSCVFRTDPSVSAEGSATSVVIVANREQRFLPVAANLPGAPAPELGIGCRRAHAGDGGLRCHALFQQVIKY
jgi:hypothetical protein